MKLQGYLGLAVSIITEFDSVNTNWQEKIRKQWEISKKFPRKKKKKVRKKLEWEWKIANWKPF